MPKILKVKEVAELLRLSEVTVFKLLGEGKLPGFKIGASWRLDMDELLRFIEKARIVAQPKPQRGRGGKHAQAHTTRALSCGRGRGLGMTGNQGISDAAP